MSTFDDETPLEFFEEPETLEAPERQRRRMRPQRRTGGPRRPTPPPPGAVALARLAGFVALAIAVVVGLVFWVGSCQGKSKHDEYASYMASVLPIAQSSASSLSAYQKQVDSPKLTLTELHSKLEDWSQQQQQDYDEALRLTPPAQLQPAHQEVLATLQLRAIGLAGLANTFVSGGSKSAFEVGVLLAKQAQLLSASDLVWAELFRLPANQAMKRAGVIGVIAPPSQIVTNPVVIGAQAFKQVYSRLHVASTSGGKLTGLRGSQLVSTEASVGGSTEQLSSSPTTVDVAADLVFKVTFQNGGNFDEANIPVTLTITVFGKPVLPHPLKRVVPFVGKGKTATASFGNLQLPNSTFGARAIVNVSVGKVPGETKLDNNKASYPVFFSLSSGG